MTSTYIVATLLGPLLSKSWWLKHMVSLILLNLMVIAIFMTGVSQLLRKQMLLILILISLSKNTIHNYSTTLIVNFFKCAWKILDRVHNFLIHLYSCNWTTRSLCRQIKLWVLLIEILSSWGAIEYIIGSILLVLHDFHFSLKRRVKMILDVIVSAPRKKFRNLRPSISQLLVGLYDEHIFLLCPLVLFNIRIQVVVPSESI